MREDLICYALGELEEPARSALEAELAASADLREELEAVRRCLASSDPGDCHGPPLPRGLAERTAYEVVALCNSQEHKAHQQAASASQCSISALFAKAPLSFVDSLVATGVMIVMASLIVPALCSSRDVSQRYTCMNNLRQLGTFFKMYSAGHDGFFPAIAPQENAGMFALRLVDAGLIESEPLQQLLACAGARTRADGTSTIRVYVPTFRELDAASFCQLARLRAQMGGDYGYRIGYVERGWYHAIHTSRDNRLALLGDTPRLMPDGYHSPNHVGGQNVLWEDGSASFEASCLSPCLNDHLYLNTAGLPAAGTHFRDMVLAPSHATPGVSIDARPSSELMSLLAAPRRGHSAPQAPVEAAR